MMEGKLYERERFEMATATPNRLCRQMVTTLAISVLIFSLAILFSFRYAPVFQSVRVDSGVFLYGGEQLLQGNLPYKDFWDHKPPLIFVLDAIGLSFGIGRWGVWLFETMLFASAITVLFVIAKRKLGTLPSLIVAGFIILSTRNNAFFEGGNLTEGYAVSFSLLLLVGILLRSTRFSLWFIMGVTAGIIFFTKQSCIGIPFAIGVVLVWLGFIRRKTEFRKCFIAYCSGGLLLTAVALLTLWRLGILYEFWDTNFLYSRVHLAAEYKVSFIRLCWQSFRAFDSTGILNISAFIMVICFLRLVTQKLFCHNNKFQLLYSVVLVAIPAEMALIALSQRYYGHYYLTLLPLIGLGISLWLVIVREFSSFFTFQKNQLVPSRIPLVFLMAIPLFILSKNVGFHEQLNVIRAAIRPNASLNNQEVLAYLREKDSSAPLLVWGAETRLNFLSKRSAPTRYSYIGPLRYKNYDQDVRFNELLQDLKAQRQSIVIDTNVGSHNTLGTLIAEPSSLQDVEPLLQWNIIPTDLMTKLRSYIAENYDHNKVFSSGWVAYVPKKRGD